MFLACMDSLWLMKKLVNSRDFDQTERFDLLFAHDKLTFSCASLYENCTQFVQNL